jgi:hypothetical protein
MNILNFIIIMIIILIVIKLFEINYFEKFTSSSQSFYLQNSNGYVNFNNGILSYNPQYTTFYSNSSNSSTYLLSLDSGLSLSNKLNGILNNNNIISISKGGGYNIISYNSSNKTISFSNEGTSVYYLIINSDGTNSWTTNMSQASTFDIIISNNVGTSNGGSSGGSSNNNPIKSFTLQNNNGKVIFSNGTFTFNQQTSTIFYTKIINLSISISTYTMNLDSSLTQKIYANININNNNVSISTSGQNLLNYDVSNKVIYFYNDNIPYYLIINTNGTNNWTKNMSQATFLNLA